MNMKKNITFNNRSLPNWPDKRDLHVNHHDYISNMNISSIIPLQTRGI